MTAIDQLPIEERNRAGYEIKTGPDAKAAGWNRLGCEYWNCGSWVSLGSDCCQKYCDHFSVCDIYRRKVAAQGWIDASKQKPTSSGRVLVFNSSSPKDSPFCSYFNGFAFACNSQPDYWQPLPAPPTPKPNPDDEAFEKAYKALDADRLDNYPKHKFDEVASKRRALMLWNAALAHARKEGV